MKNYRSQITELISTPVPLRKLYKVFIGSILGMFFLLVFTPWVQTVKGVGRVVAYSPNERSQTISAPVEGRIKTWFVSEGSFVKKGSPIAEISDNDPDILKRLEVERVAAKKRLEASKLGASTSQKNLDRQKSLFEEGLSSKRTFELAHLEVVRYMTDEANAMAELSRIEVRLARQMNQMVVAPLDGIIQTRLSGQEGELIKSGDLLARLIPDTESRAVELWVTGVDTPLLQVGQIVRMQFEGWPAVQFSGWPAIAVGTFEGKVQLIDASDNGSGMFRIMVLPTENANWPDRFYLRQGVRAVGWMNINTVLLGYEVWRQFNAFPIVPESVGPATGEKKDSK
jgi:multidrug efflux pump subunit AcrA (membrane-fusion protein)